MKSNSRADHRYECLRLLHLLALPRGLVFRPHRPLRSDDPLPPPLGNQTLVRVWASFLQILRLTANTQKRLTWQKYHVRLTKLK